MLASIKEFLTPPTFADEDKSRVASHLYLLMKIGLGVAFIVTVIGVLEHSANRTLAVFLAAPFIFAELALIKKGYIRSMSIVFVATVWLLGNYTTLGTGGIHAVGFGINLIVVLAAGMLISLNAAIIFGLSSVAFGLGLAIAQIQGLLPPAAVEVNAYTAWLSQSTLLILTAGLLYLTLNSIQRSWKRTQQAEVRLRGIIENAPGIILETDRTGMIKMINRYQARYQGKPIYDLISTDDTPKVAQAIDRAFSSGEIVPLELPVPAANGNLIWNSIRIGPIKQEGKVSSLAVMVTDITESKHTVVELERHAQQLSTLNEMARGIIASLDLNKVLELVIADSLILLKAEGTSVLLLENNELIFVAVSGAGAAGLRGKRIPTNVGVAGNVIQTGQSALIDGQAAPQKIYRDVEKASGYHTQSLIAAPLKLGKQIIGVMEAVHTRPSAFSSDDLSILESAANWSAIAIGNARQHTELAQRLQESRTLTAISQALNETLDLDRILRLIAISARQIIPQAERTVIHLLDENERVLKPVAFDGLEERGQPDLILKPGEGIAGQVISKGVVINVADTRQDQNYLPVGLATDLRSLLVAPVQSGPHRLGTISVQSRAPSAFSKEAERLIVALGAQAALAIENARLLENTRQALKETDALYRINQGLVALKVDELLNTVVELLKTNFDYYHVQVYGIDSKTGDFILKSASGEVGKQLLANHHRLHAGDGIIGHVAATTTPFFTNTVDQVVFFIRNPLLPETKSEMVIPVKIGSQLFGLLDIHQEAPKTFSARDLQLVSAVADQLALALQSAKLYEDLQTALQQEKAIRDQLVQSERLAIMGRLLASVSHELGNPLQAIQNALFLLKSEKGVSEQGQRDLEIVLAESERMADLIDRLRSTYRPTQAEDFQPAQFNRIIEDVHALLSTHLRRNQIDFEFDPDPHLPLIPALPDQLRQVTINLFMNAVEAMPAGGVLTASTQYLPESDEVLFCVSDTGPGISESVLPHIFEAFITNKKTGTGLGLAISHEIVMKHHGRINAENKSDRGALFKVWLPTTSPESIV